jgi:hypothetical protein
MAKRPDIPKTDPAELEALIELLKQFNIEPRDAQLPSATRCAFTFGRWKPPSHWGCPAK